MAYQDVNSVKLGQNMAGFCEVFNFCNLLVDGYTVMLWIIKMRYL
jgi:hypothetical protein